MATIYYLGGGNSTNANIAFDEHLGMMRELKYDVVVYDMPGHGGQDVECDDIGMWAVKVSEFILSRPNSGPIFLVGVSLAGHIIFRVCPILERHGLDVFPIVQGSPPKNLKDATDIPQYVPLTKKLEAAFPLLAKENFTEDDARLFVECQFTDDFILENPKVIEAYINAALKTKGREAFVQSLFNSTFDEFTAVVIHWKPWLFIQGTTDAGVNPHYLDLIPKENLFERKVHLIDGPHQLAQTNPKEFTDLVVRYIETMRL